MLFLFQHKIHIRLSVVLFLTVFPIVLFGQFTLSFQQDEYSQFRSITTKDGLSGSKVLAVFQDHSGIMWIATDNGLTRFDGTHFTIFRHYEKDTNSLSSDFILCITEDIFGDLWIGTDNGLNKYHRKTNRFERFFTEDGQRQCVSNNYIRAVYADKDGILWIRSKSQFLDKYYISSGTFEHYEYHGSPFEGDYYYYSIFESSRDELWFGGRSQAPGRVADKKEPQPQIIPLKDGVWFSEAGGFAEASDGTLYAVGMEYRLTRFNREHNYFEELLRLPFSHPCAIVVDNKNRIWVGGTVGLACVDFARQSWRTFNTNSFNPLSLLSDKVYCLYKDRSGNIWIGTDNGLSIYSETLNRFRYYRQIPETEGGLSSNRVTALLEDTDGTLWIGTEQNGVDTLNLLTEKAGNIKYNLLTKDLSPQTFQREKNILKEYYRHEYIRPAGKKEETEDAVFADYPSFKHSALQFPDVNENRISALYQDKQGSLYIGLWSHVGFNVYDKKNAVMKRYALFGASMKKGVFYYSLLGGSLWGSNWYQGFLADDKGRLWCATWEGVGLNLFDRSSGMFLPHHYTPANKPQQVIFSSKHDTLAQRLYMGSGYYFGYYDLHAREYVRFAPDIPAEYKQQREKLLTYYRHSNVRLVDFPISFDCYSIAMDDKRNIWLATTDGLIKFGADERTVKRFPEIRFEFYSESTLIASPDKKRIWMMTTEGIYYLTAADEALHALNERLAIPLPEKKINTLYEAPDGTLWLGGKEGVLKINLDNQTIETRNEYTNTCLITGDPAGRLWIATMSGIAVLEEDKIVERYTYDSERLIYGVWFDKKGNAWLGGDNGLLRVSADAKEIAVFRADPTNQYALLSDLVFTGWEDNEENIWVSTGAGWCKYEPATGRFIDLSEPAGDCLTSRLTSCIMQDKAGDIWVGTTENGLNAVNPETGHIRHYMYHAWDTSGITSNTINCVLQTDDGAIWVGTDKGLNKFIAGDNRFVSVTTQSGLSDNRILSIQDDDSGYLWMGTQNGLVRYSPATGDVRNFYAGHGLQDNFFSRASVKLRNGMLAFGGNYGFNVFHPSEWQQNPETDEIALTNLRVKEALYLFDLDEWDVINLSYSDNSFSIDFSAVNYVFAKSLKYRYKLEGFDNDWNDAVYPNLTAKYTNLRHGKYLLTVEVSDMFGTWANASKSIVFHIATPWYYQWWFFVVLLLLLLLIVGSVVYIRERNLKKHNARLEIEVKEATAALNKFFSMVSHDLKGHVYDLDMVLHALREKYQHLEDEERLKLIEKSAEMSEITYGNLRHLLQWSLARQNLKQPHFETVDMYEMARQLIAQHEMKAGEKEVRLINEIPQGLMVKADRNMTLQVLGNLMVNAVKFSYRRGIVQLKALVNDEMTEISVADKGVGMSRLQQDRLFDLETKIIQKGTNGEEGSGFGLLLCHEFVKKQHGKLSIASEPGKGTTVTFTLYKATYGKN